LAGLVALSLDLIPTGADQACNEGVRDATMVSGQRR